MNVIKHPIWVWLLHYHMYLVVHPVSSMCETLDLKVVGDQSNCAMYVYIVTFAVLLEYMSAEAGHSWSLFVKVTNQIDKGTLFGA